MSLKKYENIKEKGYAICNCFNSGYSMGGIIAVVINIDGKNIRLTQTDTREEYAKSSKYKATHGYNEFVLTIKQLEQIEIIGGVPTIKQDGNKIAKCLILLGRGSKNNYNISFQESFVTKDFHGTYNECLAWRKKQYLQCLKERSGVLYNRLMMVRKEEVLNRFVGYKHSIDAGNCKVGTQAFAQKHNLDISFGYKLGYLFELDPNSYFVQRVFNSFI